MPSSVFRHAPRPLHISMAPADAAGRVVEERDRVSSRVLGAEAQVGRQRGSVNDLAGIEEAVRIEGLLDRAERVVERRPEHLLHERAAHEPVAVLAGERSAELEHEIGDVVGDRFELLHAGLGLHVHDRPHVQASDGRVRVDAGGRLVTRDDGQEALDVVAQTARGRPRCPRRTRATWRRPSSPSTVRGPLRAGSRCAPAPARSIAW